MIWLFVYSFLSGIGTLLAPCIWPVVPMILSPSVVGKDQRKALGIVTGIIFSFAVFTFIVAMSFQIFHLHPSISKNINAIVTAFFGILLLMPDLTQKLNEHIRRFAKTIDRLIEYKRSPFTDGVITGIFLGLIWSPSTGPIISTISAITTTEHIFIDVLLITTAYILGLGIPLVIIGYAGQTFFKQKKVSPHASRIQRIIGIAMIVSALLLVTNLDAFLGKQFTKMFPQTQTLFEVFKNEPNLPNQIQK